MGAAVTGVKYLDGVFPPLSAPGETTTCTIGGVLYASYNGGAYAAIGGGGGSASSGRSFYEARAASLLGSSSLLSMYYPISTGKGEWSQSLTGVGAAQSISIGDNVDPVLSLGGWGTFGTGTATNGASEFFRGTGDGSSGFTPFAAYNDNTVKFYTSCSFQLSSTPDANVACGVGMRVWAAGVFGANSTTKYSLRVGSSGGAFHYVTSTISIDTGAHVMESWHDGVSAWLSVGGETPVGVADAAFWPLIGVNNSFPIFSFAKVAGTTNNTGGAGFIFCAINPPY